MNVIPMNGEMTSETSVSTLVLELFLRYDFWKDHHHMISPEYFEKESRKIFDTITNSHQKYGHDLNIQEIEALILANNPLLTSAERASILSVTRQMNGMISPDIAKDVLRSAFREYIGQTIANLGLELMDGTAQDLSKIQELIERYQDGFQPDEVLVEVSMEYDDIFNEDVETFI